MTARWGMTIDASRCVGCFNCHLACRDEHSGIDHLPVARAQNGASWIDVRLIERGSFPKVKVARVPVPCLQCENAPCMAAAPDVVFRRPDGIVVIDPVKAAGRKDLVAACPYGAIHWNEESRLAQKCTFCAHLLDEGCAQPRCVEVCPVDAITFGDLDDPRSAIAAIAGAAGLQELEPRMGAAPRVRYLGLPTRFVAGEVAFSDRPDEPASGVPVSLRMGSRTIFALTDAYGDFEFDGLAPDVQYVLRVECPDYEQLEMAFGGDIAHLGTLVLSPKP